MLKHIKKILKIFHYPKRNFFETKCNLVSKRLILKIDCTSMMCSLIAILKARSITAVVADSNFMSYYPALVSKQKINGVTKTQPQAECLVGSEGSMVTEVMGSIEYANIW